MGLFGPNASAAFISRCLSLRPDHLKRTVIGRFSSSRFMNHLTPIHICSVNWIDWRLIDFINLMIYRFFFAEILRLSRRDRPVISRKPRVVLWGRSKGKFLAHSIRLPRWHVAQKPSCFESVKLRIRCFSTNLINFWKSNKKLLGFYRRRRHRSISWLSVGYRLSGWCYDVGDENW